MIFEDEVSFLIREMRMPWMEVRRLDMVTFQEATRSMKRVDALEKKTNAWTLMHAAQADYKEMKEWLSQYDEFLRDYDGGEPGDDFERFMASKHAKGA